MRKPFFLFLALLFLAGSGLHAQRWKKYRHEVLGGIGGTLFLGEVGGGKGPARDLFLDLDGKATRYCVTGGYRYRLGEIICAKGMLTYAQLYGSDKLSAEPWRQSRNLTFRAPLVELSVVGELYVIRDKIGSRYKTRGMKSFLNNNFSAYLFGGVGGIWFNPRGQFDGNTMYPGDGKWYSLKPLATEGQGLTGGPKPYKRFSGSLPMGFGLKYSVNRTVTVSLEYGYRYAFTDYIDDVSGVHYDPAAIAAATGNAAAWFSYPAIPVTKADGTIAYHGAGPLNTIGEQRGDPTTKDTYMFTTVCVNYKFISKKTNRPKF